MDRELRLCVDWVEVRRRHMNFPVRHDAPAHAPRVHGSRDAPAPWIAENRTVARAAAQDSGQEPLELPPPATGGAGKN
eukprot:2883555-Pyramimonas_sp.AAC.1